ncbi:Lipoxygenase [Mollisia scopiformis]|uniref:Manganese lipoxygenase n=1 Tax=Mollisia scopiformis TaxID=149040 RepID=A0A132B5Z7_MOLSC|nr:Lipoxygenase [Mollisia scopiformis]KUJ07836.1 Lipoxygenase [Mollisia scopiformis]
MSHKRSPPTPPDSAPPTPGIVTHYATELPATASGTFLPETATPAGSKRWTRNFTASQQPIPRPVISPVQKVSPVPVATPRQAPTPPAVSATPTAPAAPGGGLDNLVKIFQFIDAKFSDLFKTTDLEPEDQAIKDARDIVTLRQTYQWQQPGKTDPSYPPCLKSIPPDDTTGLLAIFNAERLVDMGLSILPPKVVPDYLSQYLFGPTGGKTMADLESDMIRLTKQNKNIGSESSIANRPDWFSDAVFGQQSFTGPNPTSIQRASTVWVKGFADQAKKQKNTPMYSLITTSDPESFYIQDYSYFRDACGAFPGATLESDDKLKKRYGCAVVTLLQLSKTGNLHPISICIDFVMSLDHSVVVFNKRLRSTDPTKGEKNDWPWRYAKTCHMISDYCRHELGAHLNNCHFIEEVTIVAAYRSFTADHIVFKLLEPHWLKTLSLNKSAREALVPLIVVDIVGISKPATYNFIMSAYRNFHFTDSYIPADLSKRGFTPETLSHPRFHNYAWAHNMLPMWLVLQKFVSSVLAPHYPTDAAVESDPAIRSWCNEMRSPAGAQMLTFPDIKTVEELTSAIVMCIHLASPQHNTINYLQCYYMSFVPAKPPCFSTPLPKSLAELQKFTESDLIAALPVNDERVWLMAEQLPYLLSYGVAEDQTLVEYAKGLQDGAVGSGDEGMEKAAKGLVDDLVGLGVVFARNSEAMDDRVVEYAVMDPTRLAVSILI